MTRFKYFSFAFLFVLLVSCGGDDGDGGGTTEKLDACGNPTNEPVNDKRCLYTVTTLTGSFNGSGGLTVDADGFIYVADFGSSLGIADGEIVSKVDPQTGDVSVFARGLNGASGNEFDSQGNLIQANIAGNSVSIITPEGEVSTLSTVGIVNPVGVTVDDQDNIYVCNCGGDNAIRKIANDGTPSQFASSLLLSCPNGLTIDENNNLYVANFNNSSILKITPDGTVTQLAALPGSNNSHLVYANGVIYALSRIANKLYEVTLDGEVSVIAGSSPAGNADGSGELSSFFIPNGIDTSPDGSKIYVVSRIVGQGNQLNPVLVRVIEKK